jgi:hypothetical protein
LSTYLWWAGNQVASKTFGWVAANPAEASLITAALANPATRKFTMDIIKLVVKENIRSWANITRGIGSSLMNRSTKISRGVTAVGKAAKWVRAAIVANPITAAVTVATGAAAGYVATADQHGGVVGPLMGGSGFGPGGGAGPTLVSGADSADDAVRQYWGLPQAKLTWFGSVPVLRPR